MQRSSSTGPRAPDSDVSATSERHSRPCNHRITFSIRNRRRSEDNRPRSRGFSAATDRLVHHRFARSSSALAATPAFTDSALPPCKKASLSFFCSSRYPLGQHSFDPANSPNRRRARDLRMSRGSQVVWVRSRRTRLGSTLTSRQAWRWKMSIYQSP